MKQVNQGSGVMKTASSAAARTDSWSPARQNFAHRVINAGSFAQKSAAAGTNTKTEQTQPQKKQG
jgi:hypothetical protein